MSKILPPHLQKIKDLRTARGMSAQQMADELHISDSSYSRIANGDTTLSFEMAMQIAEILDVPINVLAGADAPDDHALHPDSYYVAFREAKKEVRNRRSEIHILAIVVVLLIAALFYLLIDALHGNWGIIRYSDAMQQFSEVVRFASYI